MTVARQGQFDANLTSARPLEAPLGKSTDGLIAGTRVATGHGWRPADALVPGDQVLTFDNGLVPLTAVTRHRLSPAGGLRRSGGAPVAVAGGVIGNLAPLVLLPAQILLIESDLAEERFGDPFVALHAADLVGRPGVTALSPDAPFDAVTLHFAQDQAIFGAGGVILVCAGSGDLLEADRPQAYAPLPADVARALLDAGVAPAGSDR